MVKKPSEIAVIVGARPNFMKAAPLIKRFAQFPQFKITVIHTGQHHDPLLSDIFFQELDLPSPDIRLRVGGELHSEKLGRIFSSLTNLFKEKIFDGVVVFGDVNSTLAGAIAASKLFPIFHVEAGLRSHDRRMPEEINRVVVDHLSDLLFTTEPSARKNLILEGVEPEKIKEVGNLMIECLEMYKKNIDESTRYSDLGLSSNKYVVATIHRQENTDSPEALSSALGILNAVNKVTPVVIPMHPGTKKRIEAFHLLNEIKNLKVIEPLGYFEFLNLVKNSAGVVTDSGGLQEETTHLGVPCCTLRDNTERPITIDMGTNELFAMQSGSVPAMLAHLAETQQYRPIPLWDAEVSQRIVTELLSFFEQR